MVTLLVLGFGVLKRRACICVYTKKTEACRKIFPNLANFGLRFLEQAIVHASRNHLPLGNPDPGIAGTTRQIALPCSFLEHRPPATPGCLSWSCAAMKAQRPKTSENLTCWCSGSTLCRASGARAPHLLSGSCFPQQQGHRGSVCEGKSLHLRLRFMNGSTNSTRQSSEAQLNTKIPSTRLKQLPAVRGERGCSGCGGTSKHQQASRRQTLLLFSSSPPNHRSPSSRPRIASPI